MRQHNTEDRSVLVRAVYLALSICLGMWLWGLGERGNDLARFSAALTGLFALTQIIGIIGCIIQGFQEWRFRRQSEESSDLHGAARWASLKDVKKAGMLKPDGLFLGRLEGRDIYFPNGTSLMTIAPPGAGKGTCLVLTNLLLMQIRHGGNSPVSVVITDPKLENYAVSARYLRSIGFRVILLAPWWIQLSEELGIEVPDHGFNPLSILGKGLNVKDEAELISVLLLPGKANMNANDEFWLDGGRTILVAFILYLYIRYKRVDFPMLRRVLLSPPENILEMLYEMVETDAFCGALAEYGGKLLGALKNAPQQFEGWMGSAQKALSIYDSGSPLGEHVSHGEIDFVSFKKTPTALFVAMPSDRAGTHMSWLNLVISLAMEIVGRDRSNKRVLFQLDEFGNMYCPNVLRAIAQYRSQGVQAWTVIQHLNQLNKYGPESRYEFLGMSEVVNAFGIWDPDTMKLVSGWLGHTTARNFTQHITPGQGERPTGFNYNASDFSKPLMRPEDIRTMNSDEQIIFYRNLPPIKAKKVSYLERKDLRKLADPNPYYRKT